VTTSTTGSLIALRMLPGVGGSMLTPISLSIVRTTFTDHKERVRALGVWSLLPATIVIAAATARSSPAAC
jgi:MFS family permease